VPVDEDLCPYIPAETVIEFGTYPQSKVTDGTITAALTELAGDTSSWTSYQYYSSSTQSDFMKYTDVEHNGEKYRGVYFTSYRPNAISAASSAGNSYQDNNGYYTGNIYWFKFEPVKWTVLNADTGLVVSNLALDVQEYKANTATVTIGNQDIRSNNWGYSNLRSWLNASFYNTAFTSAEQEEIKTTTLDNRATNATYNASSTDDNVFILSYSDANAYWSSDAKRRVAPTDYTRCQGVIINSSYGTCQVWLRTASWQYNYVWAVYASGSFNNHCTVDSVESGVCPAMCLNLSSSIFKSYFSSHTEVADAAEEPTCTETGLTVGSHCSVCNKVLTAQEEVAALGHSFTNYVSNSKATCIEDGTKTAKCDRCDETDTKTDESTALGHDYVDHDAKAVSCTAIGWDAYKTCTRCDYTSYAEIAALGHDYVDHDAQAPTCTAIGWNAYQTCSRCDYTTYSEIAALGHDYVDHDAQAVSCTAIGWDAYKTCSRCDYTTYSEIAALGHDYVDHDAQAPTCTAIGWDAYKTCSRCDYTTYSEIAALGHTEVTDAAVAATCTTDGNTEGKHCSVCEEVLVEQKTVPAKGHAVATDEAVAATCTTDGKTEGKHCSVCKEVLVEQKTVPAKGHTVATDEAVAATCTTAGKTEGKHCSVCKEVLVAQETIPATGHKSDEGKVTTEPTYETEGVKTYTCTVCNTVIRTEAVDKLIKEEPEVMLGDIDLDKDIDVSDARLALRRAIGLENYEAGSVQFIACDVDFNNEVTVADARLILRVAIHLDDAKDWVKK